MSQANESQSLESLLAVLDGVARNLLAHSTKINSIVNSIATNGMILETDFEAEKIQLKIQSKQLEIQKLRQMLGRVRSHIKRQRQIEHERNRK